MSDLFGRIDRMARAFARANAAVRAPFRSGRRSEEFQRERLDLEEDVATMLSERTLVDRQHAWLTPLDLAGGDEEHLTNRTSIVSHSFALFGMQIPAEPWDVCGDGIAWRQIGPDTYAFVVVDSAGRSLPSLPGRNAVLDRFARSCAAWTEEPRYAVVRFLHECNVELDRIGLSRIGRFVACSAGVVDASTGRMVCASAGDEWPLFLARSAGDAVEPVHVPLAPALGVFPPGMGDLPDYVPIEVELRPGDVAVFPTAGVADAVRINPAGPRATAGIPCEEEFSQDRLQGVLLAAARRGGYELFPSEPPDGAAPGGLDFSVSEGSPRDLVLAAFAAEQLFRSHPETKPSTSTPAILDRDVASFLRLTSPALLPSDPEPRRWHPGVRDRLLEVTPGRYERVDALQCDPRVDDQAMLAFGLHRGEWSTTADASRVGWAGYENAAGAPGYPPA